MRIWICCWATRLPLSGRRQAEPLARIAILVSSWPRGAIQRLMLNLAAEFAAAGHRVDLLAPRGQPPAEALPHG